MNFQQLETFCAVAALGSFTRAAEKLNTTQSTVSMRIGELEQILGVQVLDRRQRTVRMTSKGRDLLHYATEILRLAADLKSNVGNPDVISGSIRMGVAELVALTWLPALIAELNRLYPKVEVDLEIGVSGDMIDKLRTRETDLSFLPFDDRSVGKQSESQKSGTRRNTANQFAGTAPINTQSRGSQTTDQALDVIPLGKVAFAFMASPNLGLPDTPLHSRDLEKWPLISFSQNSVLSRIQENWFHAKRSSPRKIDRSNSMEISAGLVRSGLGLSLLPITYYAEDIRAGRLQVLDVKPALPPVSFCAVHTTGSKSPLIKKVVEIAGAVSSFTV